jgi:alkylated DNA repair protein (DNA oxidative demethylase)
MQAGDQESMFETDRVALGRQAVVLRGFANPTRELYDEVLAIAAEAPFRHLVTPGGGRMSVAMTNAGSWGWHSDRSGYRYVSDDPLTHRPWPPMPERFVSLACCAADTAGFRDFSPDACLVNRYEPGAQMGAHRDFDELDMTQPIVSVSIGLPATFLWYGPERRGSPTRVVVRDGDVVVWGGADRTAYHGVRKLDPGLHPVTGAVRYNLTFRRAR